MDLKLETQSVQLNLFMSVWVKTCRSMLPLWSIILEQMGQPQVLWANFTGQIWNNKKKISQWVKISKKKCNFLVRSAPSYFWANLTRNIWNLELPQWIKMPQVICFVSQKIFLHHSNFFEIVFEQSEEKGLNLANKVLR